MIKAMVISWEIICSVIKNCVCLNFGTKKIRWVSLPAALPKHPQSYCSLSVTMISLVTGNLTFHLEPRGTCFSASWHLVPLKIKSLQSAGDFHQTLNPKWTFAVMQQPSTQFSKAVKVAVVWIFTVGVAQKLALAVEIGSHSPLNQLLLLISWMLTAWRY